MGGIFVAFPIISFLFILSKLTIYFNDGIYLAIANIPGTLSLLAYIISVFVRFKQYIISFQLKVSYNGTVIQSLNYVDKSVNNHKGEFLANIAILCFTYTALSSYNY